MISKLVIGSDDLEKLQKQTGSKTMTKDATDLSTLTGLRVAVTGGTRASGWRSSKGCGAAAPTWPSSLETRGA